MKQHILYILYLSSVSLHGCWVPGALETERCRIRPSRASDIKKVYSLITDYQVGRYLFGPELSDQEIDQLKTTKNKLLLCITDSNLFPLLGKRWIIEHKDTHEFIGQVGFSPIQPIGNKIFNKKKYINIGGACRPKFWHYGYWQEAVQKIIEISTQKNIMYVLAINPKNSKALKVAQKMGFNENGIDVRANGNIVVRKFYTVQLFTKEK